MDLQFKPIHLCSSCKYVNKCKWYSTIVNTLYTLEVESLDSWGDDLSTAFQIRECGRYSVNFELLNALEEYAVFDEDEEED